MLALGTLALWQAPIENALWRVLAPALVLKERWFGGEQAMLRGQLEATQALVADRELLRAENAELKTRLGRPPSGSGQVVLAGVLQRPPYTPYDTLVIDAGAAQGVAEGALVSAGGQALIGRVSSVFAESARVTLFSAAGETHEGMLVPSHNGATIPVTSVGQGGGSMAAEVPAGTQVTAGDAVVFVGSAAGLTALVSAVHRADGESFVRVYLRLPANPSALRYVEVWR